MDPRQRPFRFGTVVTGGTEASLTHWTDFARRVEDLGFSTLQVADHYRNQTVCTPRLAAAAAVTSTLRVGSYVYDNDFRHPVLLAREAAEIDLLSNGRMELGIGAGWSKSEYDAVGVPFDDGPTRAGRYEEAVGIIRALHSGETLTMDGTYYRLEECELLVEPVQQPIPLLLGGGGPRMARFAAQRADIIGFVPRSLPGGGLDPSAFAGSEFAQRIDELDRNAAGRSDGGPERAALVFHVAASAADLPRDEGRWTDPEIFESGPYSLLGDTDRMVDTLLERRERWGLSYLTCFEEHLDLFAPVVARLVGK